MVLEYDHLLEVACDRENSCLKRKLHKRGFVGPAKEFVDCHDTKTGEDYPVTAWNPIYDKDKPAPKNIQVPLCTDTFLKFDGVDIEHAELKTLHIPMIVVISCISLVLLFFGGRSLYHFIKNNNIINKSMWYPIILRVSPICMLNRSLDILCCVESSTVLPHPNLTIFVLVDCRCAFQWVRHSIVRLLLK